MFNDGDTATISRGKYRGQKATILGPADNDQYPVKLSDGGYAVVNAGNLKAPAESTIGEGRLAAEINTMISDMYADGQDTGWVRSFVSRLSGDMPGLGARISWPGQSADEIQR